MDNKSPIAIPTDNLDQAQKFFRDVFGWDIQRAPKTDMEYVFVQAHPVEQKKTEDDEMTEQEESLQLGGTPEDPVMMVIKVNDIDQYLNKVEPAGGKILIGKQFVGHVGLYARIADRDGNAIGLWQDL